jgi:hypothetical protein
MIPAEWLKRQESITVAEVKNMVNGIPFGYIYDEWIQFRRKIKWGDTLWSFCSSPESWNSLAGSKGYAIVRRGRIIDVFITEQN